MERRGSSGINAGKLVVYAFVIGAVALIVVLIWPTLQRSVFFNSGSREQLSVGAGSPGGGREVEIVTLLPKDAIRSIDRPTFVSAEEGDIQLRPDEPVIGLTINGESRAYSTFQLSRHEIVNDVVGGRPVAVTW